ncbi:MAG: hypothetical protein ACC608_05515 [Anaerofustis sp.]
MNENKTIIELLAEIRQELNIAPNNDDEYSVFLKTLWFNMCD